VRGRVEVDQPVVGLADGVVECLTQGGADTVHGGRPGGAQAFDAGPDVGVFALPGDLDGGVAVLDLLEHLLDVFDGQLHQCDGAHVRDQVDTDVGCVGEHGAWFDLAPGFQPLREVLADGEVEGDGEPGADPLGDGVAVRQRLVGLDLVEHVGDLDREGSVPAGEFEQRLGVVKVVDGVLAAVEGGAP
jgi:hypothetical protein